MYIAKIEDALLERYIYFLTWAMNKNRPIFLHLEWDWGEKKKIGFKVLCVHVVTT